RYQWTGTSRLRLQVSPGCQHVTWSGDFRSHLVVVRRPSQMGTLADVPDEVQKLAGQLVELVGVVPMAIGHARHLLVAVVGEMKSGLQITDRRVLFLGFAL